ncbi:DUF4058 domain-containing protein [bacterium]|nr:DUF4058 domain-containing protein [bacterium]
MPLRDHFHPPLSTQVSWEGFHALWPGMLTVRLNAILPAGFRAEPRVHLGALFEIDVAGFERDEMTGRTDTTDGGVATAALVAPHPTLTADADLSQPYEYEVQLYDESRGRTLVAAVEIVSPGNKDRPEARRVFAAKCAALVRQGVCVAVVDVVTDRSANLYADTLDQLGLSDPTLGTEPPGIYAAAFRRRPVKGKPKLDAWSYPVRIGQPLPSLPLWLTDTRWVPLDLEAGYEDTCRGLGLT